MICQHHFRQDGEEIRLLEKHSIAPSDARLCDVRIFGSIFDQQLNLEPAHFLGLQSVPPPDTAR
jgi:hypothetical protein